MAKPAKPRRHLRDAATICPEASGHGSFALRCELDAGHDGKHKDGCAHWGGPDRTGDAR
ncbi:hypothetical protein ACFU8I_38420 [Streptomyces sp. NPDC057540]|uniref:hypothetical protein n=1 Tax=Streptomyces sp. NPDC057540 TaxID=3346160 RepID=UPI003676A32B